MNKTDWEGRGTHAMHDRKRMIIEPCVSTKPGRTPYRQPMLAPSANRREVLSGSHAGRERPTASLHSKNQRCKFPDSGNYPKSTKLSSKSFCFVQSKLFTSPVNGQTTPPLGMGNPRSYGVS